MMESMLSNLKYLSSRLSRPQRTMWISNEVMEILEVNYEEYDFEQLIFNQFGHFALIKRIREIFLNTFSIEELHQQARKRGMTCYPRNSDYQSLDIFKRLFDLNDDWQEPVNKDFSNIGLVSPVFGAVIESSGKPHYYQLLIKYQCLKWYFERKTDHCLVSMPTGSGKTRTAVEFLIDLLRINKSRKILWLAHRRELLYQTAVAFKAVYLEKGDDDVVINFNFDSHSNWFDLSSSKQVVFSSYDKVSSDVELVDVGIDLVVIDEAHYTTAETYEPRVNNIKNSNNSRLLGLTATPMRADDELFRSLRNYYQLHISLNDVLNTNDSVKQLQDESFLARIEYENLNIPEIEFNPKSRVLNNAIITKCKALKIQGKNIIIFAMSKAHAIALNCMLILEGVESACIVGETPFTERDASMRLFKEKKLSAIFNYDILTTGVDIPGMNSILVLRRFNERHTAIQVLGRVLRGPKNGGNEVNSVIFVNDLENKNINELYNY